MNQAVYAHMNNKRKMKKKKKEHLQNFLPRVLVLGGGVYVAVCRWSSEQGSRNGVRLAWSA
jgi:hypothetical protein